MNSRTTSVAVTIVTGRNKRRNKHKCWNSAEDLGELALGVGIQRYGLWLLRDIPVLLPSNITTITICRLKKENILY